MHLVTALKYLEVISFDLLKMSKFHVWIELGNLFINHTLSFQIPLYVEWFHVQDIIQAEKIR